MPQICRGAHDVQQGLVLLDIVVSAAAASTHNHVFAQIPCTIRHPLEMSELGCMVSALEHHLPTILRT